MIHSLKVAKATKIITDIKEEMKMKYVSIGRNMNIADKYFRLYLRSALNPYELNAAEGTVLLVMYGKDGGTEKQIFHSIHGFEPGGNTQDELIGQLHYDKGVMARTMKTLEEKGYVERRDNPADSRSYLFYLTEQGKNFKETLLHILRIWQEVLLKNLDEKTLDVIEKALEIMAQNAAAFCMDSFTKNAEPSEREN